MKRFIFPVAALVLCSALLFISYAHSGKTDIQGGHNNSSTGEYHYHHGYPAHQHSDMDGDGTVDCPYTFEETTSEKNYTRESELKSKATEKKYIPAWLGVLIELLLTCSVLWAIYRLFYKHKGE